MRMGRWGSCGVPGLHCRLSQAQGSIVPGHGHLLIQLCQARGSYAVSCLAMGSLAMAGRQWPSVGATQGSTNEGQDQEGLGSLVASRFCHIHPALPVSVQAGSSPRLYLITWFSSSSELEWAYSWGRME